MTIESNEAQLDAQQHRAAKRKWSAPIVIESDMSDTNLNPHNIPSPRDVITGSYRAGTNS